MHDIQSEFIKTISNKINNKLDDKFKEACSLWGVDINNHEEVKNRCTLINYEGNEKRELHIDGKLVMIFTTPMSKQFDFNQVDKFTISAEFFCSEIAKPTE